MAETNTNIRFFFKENVTIDILNKHIQTKLALYQLEDHKDDLCRNKHCDDTCEDHLLFQLNKHKCSNNYFKDLISILSFDDYDIRMIEDRLVCIDDFRFQNADNPDVASEYHVCFMRLLMDFLVQDLSYVQKREIHDGDFFAVDYTIKSSKIKKTVYDVVLKPRTKKKT